MSSFSYRSLQKVSNRLSLVLVFFTLGLILLGGIVHSTQSSLACPDWPLCFGKFFPKMEGKVFWEHGHRLVALVLMIGTLGLTILLNFRSRQEQNKKWALLGFLAFGVVCCQALWGGLTVLYGLPILISTAHLATSMLFLSILVTIFWQTSLASTTINLESSVKQFVKEESHQHQVHHPEQQTEVLMQNIDIHHKEETRLVKQSSFINKENSRFSTILISKPLRWFLWIAAGATYFQIVLGAFVRHSGAGLVCADFPLCHGQILPWPIQPPWDGYVKLFLHDFHRLWGVVVAILLFAVSICLASKTRGHRKERVLAFSLPSLVCLQIFLGYLNVTSGLSLHSVTTHLGLGAVLLSILVSLLNLTTIEQKISKTTKGAQ